jgi:predicted nuclease of predicted toxin-antitoxin system
VKACQFHLDEDTESHALMRALRDRGVDLTTTSELGLGEASDEQQLEAAALAGRVLVTYNAADFCRLHGEYLRTGRHHAGIVIAAQQQHSAGDMMRRLLRLRSALDAEAMRDRLEFLSRW